MKIKFIQLNLHKSSKANAEISSWLADGQDRVALCQEPGYNKGKLKNIFPNIKTFMANLTNPEEKIRACILIKSDRLKPFKLAQFCDKDQVAVLLN